MAGKSLNIGFISFRFSGTDGVSLETAKWAEILEEMGHKCFYFAGECDRPQDRSMIVEKAHFQHPEIKRRHQGFWNSEERSHEDGLWITEQRESLYRDVSRFVGEFSIDLLIPQNLFSYPLNIQKTSGMPWAWNPMNGSSFNQRGWSSEKELNILSNSSAVWI